MTTQTDREELVEVHGLGQASGPMVNVIMKVPGISQFVEPYRGHREDIADAESTIRASASGCPKADPEGWMEDCGGDHPTWNTTAVLRRGALKEPTRSGQNAGQKRDPSVDFNYRWEVVKFLENGPSPKKISSNGEDVVEMKLDNATILMLQREMISNDRTALMTAVQWGNVPPEGSNLITEDQVESIARVWGDMLNERALSRAGKAFDVIPPKSSAPPLKKEPQGNKTGSGLVDHAVGSGAVVTSNEPFVRNIEDVKVKLSDLGVTDDDIRRRFGDAGYENGADYLRRNKDDYQGLFRVLSGDVVRSRGLI